MAGKRRTAAKNSSIAKAALKNFRRWYENDDPKIIVRDKDGNIIHRIRGEIFIESPMLSDRFGKHRYYISSRGRLVSFAKPDSPRLLTPLTFQNDPNEREKYRINPKQGNKKEITVSIHRLVAEAFTVYAYGLATEEDEVHHIRSYLKRKGIFYNNNPKYLEYVTKAVHKLLTKIQKKRADERSVNEEIEILKTLSKIAGIEAPDKITIITQDLNDKNIVDIQSIKKDGKQALNLQLEIRAAMCTAILNIHNLDSGIRFAVYAESEGKLAISVYEYNPEEKKSHRVPVESKEELLREYNNSKAFVDGWLQDFYSLFDKESDKPKST